MQSPFFLSLSLSFRIPSPSVTPPCRPFISDRAILTADSRAARKPAVFIYGIETPPFCIFIILPQLEAGFCMYYVVSHVLYPSRRGIFLLKKKKERKNKETE